MLKKKEDELSRNLYYYLIEGYYLDDEANVNIDHLKNILSGEKMVYYFIYYSTIISTGLSHQRHSAMTN